MSPQLRDHHPPRCGAWSRQSPRLPGALPGEGGHRVWGWRRRCGVGRGEIKADESVAVTGLPTTLVPFSGDRRWESSWSHAEEELGVAGVLPPGLLPPWHVVLSPCSPGASSEHRGQRHVPAGDLSIPMESCPRAALWGTWHRRGHAPLQPDPVPMPPPARLWDRLPGVPIRRDPAHWVHPTKQLLALSPVRWRRALPCTSQPSAAKKGAA